MAIFYITGVDRHGARTTIQIEGETSRDATAAANERGIEVATIEQMNEHVAMRVLAVILLTFGYLTLIGGSVLALIGLSEGFDVFLFGGLVAGASLLIFALAFTLMALRQIMIDLWFIRRK